MCSIIIPLLQIDRSLGRARRLSSVKIKLLEAMVWWAPFLDLSQSISQSSQSGQLACLGQYILVEVVVVEESLCKQDEIASASWASWLDGWSAVVAA